MMYFLLCVFFIAQTLARWSLWRQNKKPNAFFFPWTCSFLFSINSSEDLNAQTKCLFCSVYFQSCHHCFGLPTVFIIFLLIFIYFRSFEMRDGRSICCCVPLTPLHRNWLPASTISSICLWVCEACFCECERRLAQTKLTRQYAFAINQFEFIKFILFLLKSHPLSASSNISEQRFSWP